MPDTARDDLLAHIDAVYRTPLQARAYITELVQSMARRRAIRAAVYRIAELNEVSGGGDPTTEIAEVMRAALSVAGRSEHPVVSVRRDVHLLPTWEGAYQSDAVPTYLPTLDRALRGGLLRGELGVVLAPPHRGKTLTLVNLAVGALVTGNDALYVTTEDGVRGIGPRVYARLIGMEREHFLTNMPTLTTSLRRMIPFLKADLRIVYRPPRRTGVPDLATLLDQLEQEDGFRPKMLVVDYPDRLRPPRKRGERWDELLDIYMELMDLAHEYHVALWGASQSTRAGYSKEIVDMDDFAGSFAKAAEADVVVAYSQTREEKDAGEARLLVAKSRNRSSGRIIHVYVDEPRSTLTEVPLAMQAGLVCNRRKTKGKKGQPPASPPAGLPSPIPGPAGA